MSTYVIGDIHGCYEELDTLLTSIAYNKQKDKLLFTGDIINGGPKSIETLIFIKSLKENAICVLGNHDLTLISMYLNPNLTISTIYGIKNEREKKKKNNTLDKAINEKNHFQQILTHPNSSELLEWLIKRPLLHYIKKFNTLLIHAGLYPFWGLEKAIKLAKEAETILQSAKAKDYLANMYGDHPEIFSNSLTGYDRFRFIINAITRMRFCNTKGSLELKTKGTLDSTPKDFKPWFFINNNDVEKNNPNLKIIFGHWSALLGKTNSKNVVALDTGCIWGGALSAMRLEDNKIFQVGCPAYCTF